MEDVEEFIEDIFSDNVRAILYRLVDLIELNLPEVNARIKHKIPFFAYKKDICYLNPQKEKVVLGFVKGALLADSQRKLVAKDRKQIRQLVFRTVDEIDDQLVSELLQEAILLNEN